MTNRFDTDSETLALLRRADPLNDPRVEADAGLDTDPALRVVLAAIERESAARQAPGRRGSPLRRRSVRLGLAGAGALAAVAVAAFGLGSSGHGEISTALRSSGVGLSSAEANVIVRAEQALAAPQGTITETESTLTKEVPGEPAMILRDHIWADSEAPYSMRSIESSGGGSVESGSVGDQRQIYDPATDTVYVGGHQPSILEGMDTIGTVQEQATALLRQPGVKVDRNATLDGAPAIRISAENDGEISEYWVSPSDYTPLQYVNRIAGSAGQTTITYGLYRTLGGEGASPTLLSVAEQHPTAHVVHGQAAFDAAEARVYAKAGNPGRGEG